MNVSQSLLLQAPCKGVSKNLSASDQLTFLCASKVFITSIEQLEAA